MVDAIENINIKLIRGKANSGKTIELAHLATYYNDMNKKVLIVTFEESKCSFIERFDIPDEILVIDNLSKNSKILEKELENLSEEYDVLLLDGLCMVDYGGVSSYIDQCLKAKFLQDIAIKNNIAIITTEQIMRSVHE